MDKAGAALGVQLHAEDRDRQAVVDGDVLGDVEARAVLPMLGRPAMMTRSPAAAGSHAVEVDEPGRHASDVGRVVAVVQVIDALEDAGQHRLDLEQALPEAGAGLGDLEDLGFGFVEQQADFPAVGLSAFSAISVATCARRRWTERSRTSSA